MLIFSSPVRKYRKPYCSTPGMGIGIGVGFGGSVGVNKNVIKVYVKVFKTLSILNPQMNLAYILNDYRCWSKILLSTIPTPAHDLEVKVTNLEFMLKFCVKVFKLLISKYLHEFTVYLAWL